MAISNDRWIRLVTDCITELCEYNVKIILSPEDTVFIDAENIKVGGYWDDTDENALIFACATGKPLEKWGPIFAHEFCHFLQWIAKEQIWHDFRTISVDDIYNIYNNKPITEERLLFCLNVCRDIELDCERRTVDLLKKYKIPIKISDYIRGANAYIHFYNHIKQYRRWYPPKKMPYARKGLLKASSPKFLKSYDSIPAKMAAAYKKYYPIKRKSNLL